MKKKLTITGIIFVTLVTGILTYYIINNRADKKTDTRKYEQFDYLPALKVADFESKINSGERFFVYIWRPDCGDSKVFNQEFEQLFVEFKADGSFARVKYDLDNKMYSFDVSEIIDRISNKEQRDFYRDLYGFYFTPSLVLYEDKDSDGVSEVVNIAEWDPSYGFLVTDYLPWFYDNKLITPVIDVYHEGKTDKQN